MKNNRLLKIQSIIISLILILQIFLPIISEAKEKDIPKITVSREKIDNTNILTITDIEAKITDVRIVYGEKITEAKYFLDEERNIIQSKGETLQFKTISEKDGIHEIQTSFDIKNDCFEYTIFVLDEDKNAFLYNYSITENTLKIVNVTSSEENKKELTINVVDTESNITKIKIMKVSSEEEQVDFKIQGINIGENYNTKEVTEKYVVPEDGIYKIYAENEKNSGFIWTQRVYSENPLSIEYKQNEEQKNKLDIKVQDKLFDIACVKIAKYELNREIDWEKVESIYPNEQETNLENLSYIITDEGKYSIFVEDTQGFKYTKTTSRIYINDENKPSIKAYINKSSQDLVNILATDEMYKIKEMNVAVGENLNIDEIQEKAIKLDITPSNTVEATYPVQEEKTIYIYCISEDNQAFIFEADFKAIEIVGEENKPEENKPEENKPEENKPEENKPEENKPEENKPEENKPEENKPEENKPEENKPEEDRLVTDTQTKNNNQKPNTSTNKTSANKTEVKDSTTSNKPLPKTGLEVCLTIILIGLAVNSIVAYRKYKKCR